MVRTLFATPALLAAAHSAQAQARAQLAPESRVRVTVPRSWSAERSAATVTAAGEDSVVLQISGLQRTLAYRDIRRLEVSRGTRRPRSVVWGAVTGAGVGLLASEVDRRAYLGIDPAPPYSSRRRATLMFAGAGAGLAFGFLIPADRWELVPLP